MSRCCWITVKMSRYDSDKRGFSVTELIVVMGIFLAVMLITSSTFKTIANSSSQQSKSIETQIEGVVGLEILRADLERAGYGLPWTFQDTITATNYVESVLGVNMPKSGYWPSGDPSSNFNDATAGIPRPILSANTNFNIDAGDGAKYIVIKSASVATNDSSKKWTNVSYLNGAKTITSWGDQTRDFAASDRVIVIKNNLNTTPPTRQLMVASGIYSTPFSSYSTLIRSPLDGDTYQIYGISDKNLTMPFNRADYYINIPSANMPQWCAPNTGVLYKSNINHYAGSSTDGYDPTIPLLDCVADMQIIYGLDTSSSGAVNLYSTTPPATAAEQRSQVRELRVYILAQDGKKDILYNYSSVNSAARVRVGESINGIDRGRMFPLRTLIGSDYKYYRWKVYTIVVRPKNLIQ